MQSLFQGGISNLRCVNGVLDTSEGQRDVVEDNRTEQDHKDKIKGSFMD